MKWGLLYWVGLSLLPGRLAAQPTTSDPGSLDALQDILLPSAVPFWPPAPAWYWLAATLALLALRILLIAVNKYQKNQYRREAKHELKMLLGRNAGPAEVSALLKRVACYIAGRENVASLSGMDWVAWLNLRCPKEPFQGPVQDLLAESMYRKQADWDSAELQSLFQQAANWLSCHRYASEASK